MARRDGDGTSLENPMKRSMRLSFVVAGACLAGVVGCAHETKTPIADGEQAAVEATTSGARKPKPIASAARDAPRTAQRSAATTAAAAAQPTAAGVKSAMRSSAAPGRSPLTTSDAPNASDRAAAGDLRASRLTSGAAAPAERVAPEPKPAS
jgi:hypothetical protein